MSQANKGRAVSWIVFVVCAVGAFALGMLATSVNQRRAEAINTRVQFVKPIAKWEADNAVWGSSFPREFDSWLATQGMNTRTRYGGSAMRDHLEEHPNLVVMWAGYPFAKGYNAPRGHYYAITDVNSTKRISEKTPGTCYSCKSPDVPRLIEKYGPEKFYSTPFSEWKDEVKNTIGCGDCHNNETMALQISRPALIEAFERQGKDIKKATHQEMRSLVCAQCHVEYYFKGKKEQYLTFPWDGGMTAEAIEEYYEKSGHVDFVHAISGAKMLKMQHPDYEVFSMGVHAYRNVSCADCHMPYKSEGGIKFTDHQVRSPLENIANSCQVCHRWSESDIKDRVFGMQDKHKEMLKRAEAAITTLHLEIGDAMKLGATEPELETPRKAVSRAQMYWDYVAANNGMGFHAPQECARVLDKASNIAMEGRIEINRTRAKYGATQAMALPDLGTKEKAQAFIKAYVDAQNAKTKQSQPVPTTGKA
jgi:nitrite reductase (cytochrome c-552)